ncbi:MAG: hypothetical protein HRT90_10345 [Candidatus Margulisbacteria bacterium]|nr:hypothetical protein [Candidatus Margulisiibacteriota bacterium]
MKIIYTCFILCLLLLSGCKSTSGFLLNSFDKLETNVSHSQVIAKDIVKIISNKYGPGKTTFLYIPPDTALGLEIESLLRKKGYAVTNSDTDTQANKLVYAAEKLFENYIVVRVQVGEYQLFNRAYRKENDKLIPVGNFSVKAGL